MNRLLIFLITAFFTLTLSANVGEQAYNEKWRAYFVNAWHNSLSDRCLSMADTMYVEGEKHNGLLLQCRALSVKANYYFFNPSKGDAVKTTDELKQLGRKEPRLYAYFYFASLYSVGNSLNHKQLIAAIREAHIVEQQSNKDKLKFGYHCAHILNSLIYINNGEYDKGLVQSEEAIKDASDNNDRFRAYQSFVLCYKGMRKYDKAMDVLDRMYGLSANDWQRFQVLYQRCMTLYASGQYEEYLKCYKELKKVSAILNNKQSDYMCRARIYYLCCSGKFDEAMSLAVQKGNSFLSEQIDIMKAMRNYGGALDLFMRKLRYDDSLSYIYTKRDFTEIDREVGNMTMGKTLNSIQLDNMRMKTENMRLDVMNSELELVKSKARTQYLKENNLHRNLLLNEKADELERLEANERMTKMDEESVASAYAFRKNVMWIFIIALSLITAVMIAYLYYKRKMEKRIRLKNEELAQACQLAEESQQRKQTFLKIISHEIRTPINAVMGFTEILTTPGLELPEEDLRDIKMRISTNSHHLQTLVSDILDTKGLETGKLAVNINETKVNEVCRSALSFVRERCDYKGLKLRFDTDVDDDYTIMTDRRRLEQVLINYLTNAEKNTESGHVRLSFSIEENPDYFTFAVEDTGCGVPEDKADSLFKRFEKVNQFVQGAGMGLYMCRIIAKRLNGVAELDKKYKNGARFLFKLKKAVMMLILLMLPFGAVCGQTARDMNQLYIKTKQELRNPKCLQLADSLYRMALKCNDVDMQCKALYVYVAYYLNHNNDELLYRSCERLMKHAENKPEVKHYYYLAWYTRINRLFLTYHSAEALRHLNAMRQQAEKEHYVYGIARCYRAVGNIYQRNGNYSMAIENFVKELHTIEFANTRQDIGDVYEKIGTCQCFLGLYKEAAETFDKAIKVSVLPKVKSENRAWRAIVAFKQNDRDTFLKYYRELCDDPLAMQTMAYYVVQHLRMFYYISQNQWEEAFKACYTPNPTAMDYMLLADCYYFKGDLATAFEMKCKRLMANSMSQTDVQREDVAHHLSLITKNEMEMEKLQLEQERRLLNMNNEKLNLNKVTLELDNERQNESIERTIEINGKLALKAQNAKIEQAKMKNKIKKQQDEMEFTQNRRNLFIMFVGSFALLVLLSMAGYIAYRRRNNLKILKEKNMRLQEELEKVKESERMTEEFLNQMSHDVNQPLNSIMGFTELLLRDTYKNDDAGKRDARKFIEQSTQQLINIVTDAVDKAM